MLRSRNNSFDTSGIGRFPGIDARLMFGVERDIAMNFSPIIKPIIKLRQDKEISEESFERILSVLILHFVEIKLSDTIGDYVDDYLDMVIKHYASSATRR